MSDPFRYCLVLLKKRFKSRFELDQAMKRKGVDDDERKEILDQLTESGLVDDLRFARAWIHTRDLLRPRGEALLRQELYKKGIDKEIMNMVLAERSEQAKDEEEDQLTEFQLAQQVVAGKKRLYSNLDPEVRKRRLMGLLSRRGFSYDVIRRILEL